MITSKSISRIFSVFFILVFMLTQVGPAHAISSGTISGTLKDAAGNPITWAAIQVRAVKKSDGSEVAVTFSNVADGTYQFTGLPLNINLALIASDENPDVDGYVGQYYNNVDILEWAETITLTGGAPDRVGVDFNLRDGSGGVTLDHLTFNTRVGRLLNDVNIRRAIAYGTDRSQLLYNAFLPNGNLGIIMHSMVAPGLWYQAAQSDLTIYSFDPLTAESILTAAGWVDSNSDGIRDNGIAGPSHVELALDFVTTTAAQRTASANLFKTQMQGIGILVNVATYPAADFFSGDPLLSPLNSGNFDIAEFAWVPQDYDTLPSIYNVGDVNNFGGYFNGTLETYFNAARDAKVAGDQSTFQAKALLWQQLFSQDLPILPLFTRNWVTPAGVSLGTNVNVISGNANATFAHVTGDGWFGITASKYNPNDLPAGYLQGDSNVYDVGSNAVFDTAQVCITYDASAMSMANEYFLKMFHFVNGTWTDVTTPGTLNIASNQICGDFTSFSVVALMYNDSGGGSISGTVKDNSGVPITGVAMTVSAEIPDGVLAQANTNPVDGTYTISGLPLGLNIKVNAFDNNFPLTYGKEYYPETAFLSMATVFNLSAGTPSYSGINFTLPQARPGPNSIEHLTFNVRPGRFLNDPLIRRAIAYGTDRERMLKAFLSNNEYGVVLSSLIAPGYWSQPAYSQVSVYPYNPSQAISILDAAGITDHNSNGIRDIGGNDIILDFKTTFAASRIVTSAIFVENMAAIGIQVNVTNVTGTDFFSSDPAISPLAAGNFDIVEFAWTGGNLSVDDTFPLAVYQTGNSQNSGGYSNVTADAEYNAAFAATNRTEMLPHVLAYYAATTLDMPSLPLFSRENAVSVDTVIGTNVLADLSSVGATVLYQNATTSGRTAALASVINPNDLPANNGLVALYEVGSNVTMSAGTNATVCVNYSDAGLTNMQENNLQLYRLTMTTARTWTNIFSSRDTVANRICGFTTDFSTFAVLIPINFDVTAPIVTSSARLNPNPSNLSSINFTLTFSESVTGVDTVMPFADFVLTTDPGISGASITGVTPVSGNVYTVMVDTGNGNGMLRLDVVDDNSIVDWALNPLGGAGVGDGDFTTGQMYDIEKPILTVAKAGTGSGTVTSSPVGINCGLDCSETYAAYTVVTLTATRAAGSMFTGWSGACSGTGSCVVSMTSAKSVTATFSPKLFNDPGKWTSSFDLSHGWTVNDFVRTVGDVNNDGRDDLIGFGLDGVYVALSNGSGFGAVSKWSSSFDLSHGWTVSQFVRTVGDVNNDGRDELIGFGLDGVYVALSNGTSFDPISKWSSSFDLSHGWTVSQFVRTVGDVNNDGRDDLIGFGLDGVYVALSNGSGFGSISKWSSSFDLSHGWTVSQFVRTVGDVNFDGRDDLIGFGLDGVYVALSNGTSFGSISKWSSSFDLSHGWTVSGFVRTVGDVNNDGRDDLIGFGQDGVYVALSNGASFDAVSRWTNDFDLSHGWTVSQYVRTVGDVNNDGKADLVGFGLDGVYIGTAK